MNGRIQATRRSTCDHLRSFLAVGVMMVCAITAAGVAQESVGPGDRELAAETQQLTPEQLAGYCEALQNREQALRQREQALERREQAQARETTPERPAPEPSDDRRMQDLMRHRDQLEQVTRQMEAQLRRIPDDQDPQRQRVQQQLNELRRQMTEVDRELAQARRGESALVRIPARVEGQARRQRAPAEERARPQEPATDTAQSLQRIGDRVGNLAQQLNGLQQLTRQIEQELSQLKDRESERARALQAGLERARLQIKAAEAELSRLEQMRATRQRQRPEGEQPERQGRRERQRKAGGGALQCALQDLATALGTIGHDASPTKPTRRYGRGRGV